MPKLYDLTRFTGSRKGEGRRMIVATIEADRQSWIFTGIGLLAGIPVAGILLPILGPLSLSCFLLTVPIAHLLGARRRDGLQISNLRALDNRIGARTGASLRDRIAGGGDKGMQRKTGIIVLAGQPLTKPRIIELIPAVIPNPDHDPDHDGLDRLVPGGERRPVLDLETDADPEPQPDRPAVALGRAGTSRRGPAPRPEELLR